MSGQGVPTLNTDGTGITVAIVAGQWHTEISEGLKAGARRSLEGAGATIVEYAVPGSFELPVVSKAALENGADAVVALGVIIRGGTPHFEYVSAAATDGLTRVALDTGKPVGFGVLTLENEQQGLDRAGLPGSIEDKGAEAAEAAIATVRALQAVRSGVGSVPPAA